VADVAASALESLCDVRSGKSSAGRVGVGVGISTRRFDLRKRDIAKMDGQSSGLTSRLVGSVTRDYAVRRAPPLGPKAMNLS